MRGYTPSQHPDAEWMGLRCAGKYRRRTKKETRIPRTNNSYSTEMVEFVKDNCILHDTGGTMSVREVALKKSLALSWVRAVAVGKIRVKG